MKGGRERGGEGRRREEGREGERGRRMYILFVLDLLLKHLLQSFFNSNPKSSRISFSC